MGRLYMSTTKELLAAARQDKLDDLEGYGKGSELWKDTELLRALNNAQNEWARRTLCLRDSSTEAICKILLLANQYLYDMDSRIIAVHGGTLETGWPNVEPKDEIWMENNFFSWKTRMGDPRYLIADCEIGKLRVVPYFNTEGYYAGTMTFTDTTKKIELVGALFSTYLSVGDSVVISGTVSNNGTKTVVTATTDYFTVSQAVVLETVAAVVKKVRDNLWLSVSRLPLNQLTGVSVSETPEINFDYHSKLIHGILREAYDKRDSQTYDPQAAARHRALFEAEIARAKKEKYRLRHSTGVLRPHPGTI